MSKQSVNKKNRVNNTRPSLVSQRTSTAHSDKNSPNPGPSPQTTPSSSPPNSSTLTLNLSTTSSGTTSQLSAGGSQKTQSGKRVDGTCMPSVGIIRY